MRSYYECHITLLGDPKLLEPMVHSVGWKFSCIDGDPVLGQGVKCYATMLFNEKLGDADVLDRLLSSALLLTNMGADVIRRKVEKVIYDDRSDKVNFKCTGGCAGCHLDDLCKSKEDPLPPTDRIGPAGVVYPDLTFDEAKEKDYDVDSSGTLYGKYQGFQFHVKGSIKP